MKKHLLQFLFVFATAVGVAACGNPFSDALNDLEELNEDIENSGGTYTEEDKKATISLTFADDATLPVAAPSPGTGLSAPKGEYYIVIGQALSFIIPGDDEYPRFTGTLSEEEGKQLEAGMVFDILADAQAGTGKGAILLYELDADNSWVGAAGQVQIVSLRPLKLKFTDLKMGPAGNTTGTFVVNGTANWNK